MKGLLDWHRRHFPAMEAADAVKLIFQAELGCGHLLADDAAVIRRIEMEEAALAPSHDEPLTIPLGRTYVRLNLRRAMAEGIRPEWIAQLMRLSNKQPCRQQAVQALLQASQTADTPWSEALCTAAQRVSDDPDWLPSHSAAYHDAYAPAYRVISQDMARLLPILIAASCQWDKPRLLIVIDGPCGSGKTTLATQLQQVLDAAVVPMDDFFLPHAQKTAERLSQPGGNADWERVVAEFLTPWLQTGKASYRPYDCHADALTAAITVPPRKITILEGSYSLMPAIAQHADLRVFLTIDPEEQQRRILQRNGEEMLQRFLQRWIPLEKAYFNAFALPDDRCLVVEPQVQSV